MFFKKAKRWGNLWHHFDDGKTQINLILEITVTLLIWKWMDLSLIKIHLLKTLELPLSCKFDWVCCIVFPNKAISKKSGGLIRSMKILPPEVLFHHNKFTIRPSRKYFFHAWTGVTGVTTWIYRVNSRKVNLGLKHFLLLLKLWHIVKKWLLLVFSICISLFCMYYYQRYSTKVAEQVLRSYFCGLITRYSDRPRDFFYQNYRYCKDVYVNSFCRWTYRL